MLPPMGGNLRFITRFEDFANEEVPYMYHCHMLNHEDEGMMGQFIVRDLSSWVEQLEQVTFEIFPNPFQDHVSIRSAESGLLNIYNIEGVLLQKHDLFSDVIKHADLSGFAPGVYIFSIVGSEYENKYRIVKQE